MRRLLRPWTRPQAIAALAVFIFCGVALLVLGQGSWATGFFVAAACIGAGILAGNTR